MLAVRLVLAALTVDLVDLFLDERGARARHGAQRVHLGPLRCRELAFENPLAEAAVPVIDLLRHDVCLCVRANATGAISAGGDGGARNGRRRRLVAELDCLSVKGRDFDVLLIGRLLGQVVREAQHRLDAQLAHRAQRALNQGVWAEHTQRAYLLLQPKHRLMRRASLPGHLGSDQAR